MPQDPTSLILTRSEIATLMTPAAWRRAVAAAFRAAAEGIGAAPAPMHIAGADGGFHVKGAGFPAGALGEGARSYVAFKVNGNFPDNRARRGLPTIQGVVVLCDGADGSVLALMDSIEITLQRTAAASALAAIYLARPDSRAIAVCGCGDQALPQLVALKDVLPLASGFAWDQDPAKAEALARSARALGIDMRAAEELGAATGVADIVVTCTTAKAPFLGPEHVRPGTFVAAVGADSPDKSELRPALFAGATVVVDVLSQASAMGDLRHAVAEGCIEAADIHAELGDLVAGRKPGRTSDGEVTIFDSTGVAIQDVASAAAIYELARAGGAGQTLTLGAAAAEVAA